MSAKRAPIEKNPPPLIAVMKTNTGLMWLRIRIEKNDSDPVVPRDLRIVFGDETIARIALPKESEVKNFSLNSVEKTEAGFEIKIDWGSGVDHYELQFNFRCKESKFYLYEVRKESFSTTDRDCGTWTRRRRK